MNSHIEKQIAIILVVLFAAGCTGDDNKSTDTSDGKTQIDGSGYDIRSDESNPTTPDGRIDVSQPRTAKMSVMQAFRMYPTHVWILTRQRMDLTTQAI